MTIEFSQLGLKPQLVQTVSDLGYINPTPVQAKIIPLMLDGQRCNRPVPDRYRQNSGFRFTHSSKPGTGPAQYTGPGFGPHAGTGYAGSAGYQ